MTRFYAVILTAWALSACAHDTTSTATPAAKLSVEAPRSVESELSKLTRIEQELALLEPTIRAAQASALQSRAQFDYEQLLLDLATVRLGIRKYRAGELEQPRAIEALSGDYRR
jgi:RAQPRD family integrative conjugative element protein